MNTAKQRRACTAIYCRSLWWAEARALAADGGPERGSTCFCFLCVRSTGRAIGTERAAGGTAPRKGKATPSGMGDVFLTRLLPQKVVFGM